MGSEVVGLRWREPDGHRSCRGHSSVRNQPENQTAALLYNLHKLGIIWYCLSNWNMIYTSVPFSKHKQKVSFFDHISFSWKEGEQSPLLILPLPVFLRCPVCDCLDKAQCGPVLGAGIWKPRGLVCSFLLAHCVILSQSFSFLTFVFPSYSDCGSFAWGYVALQEGVNLWVRCWGCGRRRRESEMKGLPSGISRLLDQLSCSPDYTVRSV